jgi:hypothetical protein
VRELWRIDLREFQFPLRQMAQYFFRDGGRDGGDTAIDEFGDFGHAGNLVKAAPMQKGKLTVGKTRVSTVKPPLKVNS